MPYKSRYNTDLSGKVSYGHKVIESIISLSTMEIKGVARLQGKGIRTEIVNDIINVDVYVDVMIGFSCADVAYRVQENIKRSIEGMTTFHAGTVNVNVLGVCFEQKQEE